MSKLKKGKPDPNVTKPEESAKATKEAEAPVETIEEQKKEEKEQNGRKGTNILGILCAILFVIVLFFMVKELRPFSKDPATETTVPATTPGTDHSEADLSSQSASTLGKETESDLTKDETEASDESTDHTTEASDETAESQATTEMTEIDLSDPSQVLKVQVSEGNSWGENPHFVQLDIKITNLTDKNVSDWCLRVEVGAGATIDNSWGTACGIKDGVLVITPAEYNNTIQPGVTCSDVGVILKDISGSLKTTVTVGEITEVPVDPNQNNNNNNNQNNNGNNQQNTTMLPVPEPTSNDWLTVKGQKIYDSTGKEVWLTGINWFGYNTGTNTFDGLWACDLNTSLQAIADHGFNLLRIPISAELILQWKDGKAPNANFNNATNFYLVGKDSLEIFDYVVGQCRANGIKIMMDIHCAKTDSMGHMYNVWYNGSITTADYQEALRWMAARYKNDDTIIAYDLKNEPHGKPNENPKAIWNDSTSENNWKYVAEKTALIVLEENPNVLIMIEGTEIYPKDIDENGDYHSTNEKDYYYNWWGGNLRGVADYPVDLGKYQNKVVYSPHDYGPSVYKQPWFTSDYDYDSLMEDCWKDNWFYIYESKIAPLLIGEWGGYMTEPNLTWMTHMRTLIKTYRLHHTFWCFNANSGDTGGLVKDDFVTWDEEKYEFVKEVLWQQDGKFVGLDHDIPLGKNGITLSEAK